MFHIPLCHTPKYCAGALKKNESVVLLGSDPQPALDYEL